MTSPVPVQLQNLLETLRKTRPFFKVAVATLSIGALLALFRVTFDALSMTGGDMARFEVWRLLTNFLVERNPLLLFWALHCVWMAYSIIEPIWGDVELVKFFAIVQVLSSLSLAVIMMFAYVVRKNYMLFFHVEISGAASLCGALYVAVKQFLPDSILLTTAVGRLKNTHLPGCALLGLSALSLLGAVRPVVVLQLLLGVQVAWTYLRFFQPHDDDATGDPSDHFAWATLFPSKMQPLMAALSGSVFAVLIRLRVCKPIVRHVDVARLDSVSIILPGLQTKDTERRRQKALRDLTERLSRSQRVETGSWPDMEDVAEDTQVEHTAPTAATDSSSHTTENVHLHVVSEETKGVDETPPVTVPAAPSVE